MPSIIVSALTIYPFKSAAACPIETMALDHLGPVLDRRWMIVDDMGRFITQREQPSMALITVRLLKENGSGIGITVPGECELPVTLEQSNKGPSCKATVWKDSVDARDCGDRVADYLSAYLNKPCRLLFMPDNSQRLIDPRYSSTQQQVSFADGFPLLLISEESLSALNKQLTSPVEMRCFRPNIVIKGCEPFAEDSWKHITIAGLSFDIVKPCSRCVIPSINPDTGTKDNEVLGLLARTRRINRAENDNAAYFGQNVIHRQRGTVSLGDAVEVLD